jgi:hypothetical protein
MYGKGSAAGLCTTAATVAGACTLPVTGSHATAQIALAVAAGLVAWGAAYMAVAKFSR